MTQEYTPVAWQDETTSQQGTLINAERLNQMQTAHHYADGFEEVDAVPTANPSVAYHKVVYCTADSTFYRWDGTEWTADIDDDTKRLLEQEIARATEAEGVLRQSLADHEADHNNPHQVTKAQLGLGNVDNTSDINKPVSSAQATAIGLVQSYLDAHEANHSNPHQVSKSQVGLANCDNTSDMNKPVSTAQAAALALKADKATTLAGYGITDAYTKSDTYNKQETDGKINDAVALERDARQEQDLLLSGRIDTEVQVRTSETSLLRGDVTALQAAIVTKAEIADGVTPWSSTVEYRANAFTNANGTLYRSLSSGNIGNPPASSPTWWAIYSPASGSSGLVGPDNLYTEDIGDGSATTIAVTHNLGSYDVLWCLWSNSDKGVTGVKAVKTGTNVLTLTFATAPATDEYRVLVFRPGDAARIYEQTFSPASNTVVITHNLGRYPSGISLYAPDGTKVGARMTADTTSVTLHLAGYDAGTYRIEVIA